MKFRPARPEDCVGLTDLALRSKAHWGYDAAFMEACVPVLTIHRDMLANGETWLCERDELLLGFYTFIPGYGAGRVECMFVEPAAIGSGVGRIMWQHMTGRAIAHRVPVLEVESDPNAVPFYEAMGMKVVGERPSTAVDRMLPFLKGFLAGSILGPANTIDMRLGDWWEFADEHADAISRHWVELTADNPSLFNGRVLITIDKTYQNGVFRGRLVTSPFSAFIYWRDKGFIDRGAANVFASAVVMGSDGGLILGEMAPHTANAGHVYPFAGSLDLSDVGPDKRVDMFGSAARELFEESGLLAADAEIDTPLIVDDGPRVSIAYVMRFPDDTETLAATIRANIATHADDEISDIHIIRRQSDVDGSVMPGYTQSLIAHLLP